MKTRITIVLAAILALQGVKTAEAQQMFPLYPIVVQQQSQRSADREREREWDQMKMRHAYEKALADQKRAAERELCYARREALCL